MSASALRPRSLVLFIALLGTALGLAGCDKCGNRVKLGVPTIQHSCGDDAGPAR